MKNLIFIIALLFTIGASAQVVRLGGYTSSQRSNINTTGAYPIFYNTTTAQFERWNGVAWESWGTGDGGGSADGVVSDVGLTGTSLVFTGSDGGFNGSVSLASFLDNTDAQQLGLTGNTLSVTNGGSVSLAPYLDNTDTQDLSLASNSLSLTNGGSVSLVPYLDNTDDQTASEVGSTAFSTIAATNVQAALEEIFNEAGGGTDDQTAVEVPITDAGTYYTGTEVETALQEVGASLANKLETVGVADLNAEDYGDFTVAAGVASLDNNVVASAEILDGSIVSADMAAATLSIDGTIRSEDGVFRLDDVGVSNTDALVANGGDGFLGVSFESTPGGGSFTQAARINQAGPTSGKDLVTVEYADANYSAAAGNGLPYRELANQAAYDALTTAQKASDTLWIILPDTPSAYSASWVQTAISNTNETAVSFQFADAEVGSFYDYTIEGISGGTDITGFGVIETATDSIGGIDVSALTDGNIGLTATLTNAAGTGLVVGDTIAKSSAAVPTGYSATMLQDPITSLNASAVSFQFGGAEIGADYDYIYSSSGGGTDVTGNADGIASATQTISGIDISSLPDGDITLQVRLENGNGFGSYVNAVNAPVSKTTSGSTEYFVDRAGAEDPTSSTSITGWVSGNVATWESSTVQARTGTTSFNIVSSGAFLTFRQFDYNSGSNADLPDWSISDELTFTGWVYAPSGATVEFQIPGAMTQQSITFTADTWTQFTFTGTVTSLANPSLYLYTDSEAYTYFDDMRIYKSN